MFAWRVRELADDQSSGDARGSAAAIGKPSRCMNRMMMHAQVSTVQSPRELFSYMLGMVMRSMSVPLSPKIVDCLGGVMTRLGDDDAHSLEVPRSARRGHSSGDEPDNQRLCVGPDRTGHGSSDGVGTVILSV